MPQPDWIEKLTGKFISWFSRKEVKTPLSFFFRVVGAIVVITVVAMWLCDTQQRITIFEITVAVLLLMVIGVGVFAWVRPKHLVYGETGHRAEFRLAMGTETQELEAAEVANMTGTSNTKALIGQGDKS
jgi:predicted membrane channel-forming protein YqfA (hemolysin III family)